MNFQEKRAVILSRALTRLRISLQAKIVRV